MVDLPLHPGKCPSWLFIRMKKMVSLISQIIIEEYGLNDYLKRLSNPFFFQSLGCAVGFDYHSSGLTTTVCGALKESLNQLDMGIKVAGGKGRASRKTLQEIEESNFSLPENKIEKLKYASKMSAKIDNSCVQDGYSLYHHSFIFTEKGKWVVIQQGMNHNYARRYHWISDDVKSFVEEPHSAIVGDKKEKYVLDMTSNENKEIRKSSLDIIKDNPVHLKKYFQNHRQKTLNEFFNRLEVIKMPHHHQILSFDISEQGWKSLQKVYEIQPQNYEEFVAIKGVGEKTVRSLALISELLYGNEISWKDSPKFAYCVGGKDKIPYEIDREHYDDVVLNLKEAIEMAKLNDKEKINTLKRLKNLI